MLFAIVAQGEYRLWPESLDTAGRMVYRLAYFIILPLRGIVVIFIRRVDHHWPLSHILLSTFGAPFFYYGVLFLLRRVVQRLRHKGKRPEAEGAKAAVMSRRRLPSLLRLYATRATSVDTATGPAFR
jgi:hypothetical protein